MSAKKRIDLVKYFLIDSPAAQHSSFDKIFSPLNVKTPLVNLPSDKEYATHFLNRLQSLPPIIVSDSDSHSQLYKMFYNCTLDVQAQSQHSSPQVEQLCFAMEEVSNSKNESLTGYQELEQLLALASPKTINEVNNKLVDLFKFLLNERDKLAPQELELEVNLQVSDAVIQAVLKASAEGHLESNWKELEAMQKLLRAKQYHKKGLKQIALNNFKQICTDSTASAKTRFQALDVLFIDSQQIGDTSLLELLMNEMQTRGQKKYEEYIREHLTRIKAVFSRIDSLV